MYKYKTKSYSFRKALLMARTKSVYIIVQKKRTIFFLENISKQRIGCCEVLIGI